MVILCHSNLSDRPMVYMLNLMYVVDLSEQTPDSKFRQ